MYQLIKPMIGTEIQIVKKENGDGTITFIPLNATANTDYQAFKKDIAEGKVLQDADGNEMTAEAAQEYLASLP